MAGGLRKRAAGAWWVGPAIAVWAFLMFTNMPDRGFEQSGLWQLEQAEATRPWLVDPDAVEGAQSLVSEPFRGPVNGLLVAQVWRMGGSEMDVVDAARLTNTLLLCLTVLFLYALGRRAGGALVGLGAAVALISVPRIWAAAVSPGLTAGALCSVTVAAYAMERARDRLAWLLPAVLIVAAALLTVQLAALLFLPWIYLTFFDRQPLARRGMLRARALTLWAPFVFPLAVVVALQLPPFGSAEFNVFVDYLRGFLGHGREATLYFGEVYGVRRLPWHAAPLLTVLTTPPTVLFLSVFGLMLASPATDWVRHRLGQATRRAGVEARRLAWSMLVLTLVLPLLMGTTHSHGVDLLALIVPWLSVFAGLGLTRLLAVVAERVKAVFAGRTWARLGSLAVVVTLAWGVFVFALVDTEEAYPELESYYNWLISGVDGAAEKGLPRYPHGPPPPAFFAALAPAEGSTRITLIAVEPWEAAALERYKAHGLVPPNLELVPLASAQVAVLRFQETDPDFYRWLPDFYQVIHDGDGVGTWVVREGLPLYGAALFE